MITTITSILAITVAAYVFDRLTKSNVCPICAGVGGTWLWMLIYYYMGLGADPVIIAILMGGSVVGIMYILDNRLPEGRDKLLFKTLFFLFGFSAVYSAIYINWQGLALAAAILAIITFYFMRPTKHTGKNPQITELEKKMKKCCD